jgi:hypothetical protein
MHRPSRPLPFMRSSSGPFLVHASSIEALRRRSSIVASGPLRRRFVHRHQGLYRFKVKPIIRALPPFRASSSGPLCRSYVLVLKALPPDFMHRPQALRGFV